MPSCCPSGDQATLYTIVSMPFQNTDTFSCAHIPNADGFIIRRRGKVFAIWRPGDAAYCVCMSAQDLAQGKSRTGEPPISVKSLGSSSG